MTILIKHAQIVDGSGCAPFKGDIFIKDGIISAIGNLGRQSADKTIMAPGLYASPGFIDVNTVSDHYLTIFTNPEQQNFLLQGVTTIVGGMCGASLAPLLYGELNSLREWTNINQINVDWHTVTELFGVMKKSKTGVNFATYAGHTTIRHALIGDALRDLTLGELEVFEKIISDAIKEGAVGMSSGLGDVSARGTPYSELKSLLKIIAKRGGVYATHLRNETKGLMASVNETVNISKETGAAAIISHLRPIKGFEVDFEGGLELISRNAADADVYFDIYPSDVSHIAIYYLLPMWAQSGGLEVMLQNLNNPAIRKRIYEEIKKCDLEDLSVATACDIHYLEGKSVKEFGEARDVDVVEALLRIMELSKLRATVLYKNIDYQLTVKAMSHDRALIGSNSASFPTGATNPKYPDRTLLKFLNIALSKKMMTLEGAVKKITGLPAKIFKLKKRGAIKEGYAADLAIFSADAALGVEIKDVVVNGKLAVHNHELVDSSAGIASCRL